MRETGHGLQEEQASGPGLTAYLAAVHTAPHELPRDNPLSRTSLVPPAVLRNLSYLLASPHALSAPLPAAPLLPVAHPVAVQQAQAALFEKEWNASAIRACACELLVHGVPAAIAELAAPRFISGREVITLMAGNCLEPFAATLLSAAAPKQRCWRPATPLPCALQASRPGARSKPP